jgi:CRP-like cAMP-binding protein
MRVPRVYGSIRPDLADFVDVISRDAAMQPRSATIRIETAAVLYELTAMNLYAYCRADVHAYAMVLGNINRELCRRLLKADERIAETAAASPDSATQIRGMKKTTGA